MAENANRFFVITGGPGSGKTTLINALEQAGYMRTLEAGRVVIQRQLSMRGNALPWGDRIRFAELMLAWEICSYQMAVNGERAVIFDRGVPDVLGYLRFIGEAIPEHMERAAKQFRYNRHVFIVPPWQEIFHQDPERKQDFAEAVRTYRAMIATYSQFEYELVEIPRAPVAERMQFVIDHIRSELE